MSIQIRSAREDDYRRLCELWEQLDRFHAEIQPAFFRWPPRPRPKGDLRAVLFDEHRALFVAVEKSHRKDKGGRIVGAVQLHLYDVSHQPMMQPCRRAYVEDLVVDGARRGQGIGRRLMEAAQDWAEDRGARQVVLTVWDGNQDALEFYGVLGYRSINQVLVHDLE